MTILILAHNEKELIKITVNSIRNLSNVFDGINVILLDNHSEDGTKEWADKQEDLTYVYCDEGIKPWGEAIRYVISELKIEDDLLLMQSRFILFYETIERMMSVLYSDSEIGAVGCITPLATLMGQQTKERVDTLDDTVLYNQKHFSEQNKEVMELDCGLAILKKDVVNTNLFENDILTLSMLIKDISLNLICSGKKLVVCRSVMMYEINTGYVEVPVILDKIQQDYSFLETKWGMHYFGLSGRDIIVELIDRDRKEEFTVLEIGCDCGATLMEIRNKFPNVHTIGCELNSASAAIAKHVANEVYIGNIEDQNLPVVSNSVDYIIFGDVLEHLIFPGRVLEYVSGFLKPGGKVLACIPNLMHISVVKELLNGNFSYTEYGLLDKTHVHLFTFNEIMKLFSDSGFSVEMISHLDESIEEDDMQLIKNLLVLGKQAEEFMYTAYWFLVRAIYRG